MIYRDHITLNTRQPYSKTNSFIIYHHSFSDDLATVGESSTMADYEQGEEEEVEKRHEEAETPNDTH